MGDAGVQVAVVDRDVAVLVAVGLELRGRAEDEVACRRRRGACRCSRPVGRRTRGSASPPCPGRACRRAGGSGSPVLPSAKQGEQISGPPKAKVSRPASASAEGRGEGRGRRGRWPGCRRIRCSSRSRRGSPRRDRRRGWSGCRCRGCRRRGRRRGPAALPRGPALRGSRRRASGPGPGSTRRHSRRRWRPRPARRRGSRAAARRRSAGARGRWGRGR